MFQSLHFYGGAGGTAEAAMAEKAPAFQFYPGDWFASSKVARMSHTEKGMYLDLLAHCWLDNGLPTDVAQLAAMLHLPAKRFARIWQRVLRECFIERDGLLQNPRLDTERVKQAAFRRRQSDHGKRGGRPVKGLAFSEKGLAFSGLSQTEATARETESQTEATAKPKKALLSSSSSSSSEKNVPPLPPFGFDRAFQKLKSVYPSHRVTSGWRTQTAFIDALERMGGEPEATFGRMLSNLGSQQQGQQWKDPDMIPKLENWLISGACEQVHEPAAPRVGIAFESWSGCSSHTPPCTSQGQCRERNLTALRARQAAKA